MSTRSIKAITADDRRRQREIWSLRICTSVLAIICLLIVRFPPARGDPRSSVRMNEAHGLDPTTHDPVIWPEFNLSFRVDNSRRDLRICSEEVTVTVYYAGKVILGWADVPDFCVDKRSSAELNVPMLHADVVLTDALRQLMAAELSSGDLEFEVEMRMVFPKGLIAGACDECRGRRSRKSLQVCRVKPAHQAFAPCLQLYFR